MSVLSDNLVELYLRVCNEQINTTRSLSNDLRTINNNILEIVRTLMMLNSGNNNNEELNNNSRNRNRNRRSERMPSLRRNRNRPPIISPPPIGPVSEPQPPPRRPFFDPPAPPPITISNPTTFSNSTTFENRTVFPNSTSFLSPVRERTNTIIEPPPLFRQRRTRYFNTGNTIGNTTSNTTSNTTDNITGNTTGNTTSNITGNTTSNITGNTTDDVFEPFFFSGLTSNRRRRTMRFNNTDDILNFTMNDSPVRVRPSVRQIRNSTRILQYRDISTNQTICPIRREQFTPDQSIIEIMHCGHIFDELSLRRHFRFSPRCPMCRFDIRDYEFERINNNIDSSTSSSSESESRSLLSTDNESNEIQTISSEIINNLTSAVENALRTSLSENMNDISGNLIDLEYSVFIPQTFNNITNTTDISSNDVNNVN